MIKNEKGITLVANLMVVVVLMILAAVVITLTVSEGGLVKLTQKTTVYNSTETSTNLIDNE